MYVNRLLNPNQLKTEFSRSNYLEYQQKLKAGNRILAALMVIHARIEEEEASIAASEYFLFHHISNNNFKKIMQKNLLLTHFPVQLHSNSCGLALIDYVIKFIHFINSFERLLQE